MSDSVELSKQEAIERISELTNQAQELINQAQLIADQANVPFNWELGYGMGGWYESGEWHASSQSC